jgi:hypothetical protein
MAMDPNEQLDLQTVSEPGTLFSLLDEDNKSIVRPFLTTKFCIAPRQRGPPGALPFIYCWGCRSWLSGALMYGLILLMIWYQRRFPSHQLVGLSHVCCASG